MKGCLCFVDNKKIAAQIISKCGSTENIIDAINKALEFCRRAQDRHPLICSTLELGSGWDSVLCKMIDLPWNFSLESVRGVSEMGGPVSTLQNLISSRF